MRSKRPRKQQYIKLTESVLWETECFSKPCNGFEGENIYRKVDDLRPLIFMRRNLNLLQSARNIFLDLFIMSITTQFTPIQRRRRGQSEIMRIWYQPYYNRVPLTDASQKSNNISCWWNTRVGLMDNRVVREYLKLWERKRQTERSRRRNEHFLYWFREGTKVWQG